MQVQEQPSRWVLIKRSSEKMHEIYRRTTMIKCDFNKIALQLYWNHTSTWVFSYTVADNWHMIFFLILLCLFSFVVFCFNFFSLFYCVHFAFVFILFSICFNCFFHFVHFHYLIFIINFSLLHLFLFFSFQFVFWNESKWKSSGQ